MNGISLETDTESERKLKEQVGSDGFKPRKNNCSYSLDSKYFRIEKDYKKDIPVLRGDLQQQNVDKPMVQGIKKNWGKTIGGLHVQCVQEVGGISPPLHPFENRKDFVKVLGILCPLEGGGSARQLVQWMGQSSLAKMIMHERHSCGNGEPSNHCHLNETYGKCRNVHKLTMPISEISIQFHSWLSASSWACRVSICQYPPAVSQENPSRGLTASYCLSERPWQKN